MQLAIDLDAFRSSRGTTLRDGSAVQLRPMAAGDEVPLREFLDEVSAESLQRRFCGAISLDRAAAALADCSCPGDLALLAELPGAPSIIAHAAAYRIGPDRAEVAFLIADAWQGRGLGSIMLSRLTAAAQAQGITTLLAETAPGNQAMLIVFTRSGHPVDVRRSADVVEVRLAISPLTPASALAA
jgi:acetate---CoA ligase (ADP-forming)